MIRKFWKKKWVRVTSYCVLPIVIVAPYLAWRTFVRGRKKAGSEEPKPIVSRGQPTMCEGCKTVRTLRSTGKCEDCDPQNEKIILQAQGAVAQ